MYSIVLDPLFYLLSVVLKSNTLSDLYFERNLKDMAMMMIMRAPLLILFAGGHLRYITSVLGSNILCM